MQTPTSVNPNDTDDAARAEGEVPARKSDFSRSVRQAEKNSERVVELVGKELKPALVAGLAVAALATVAGVTIALARRKRSSVWLQPERPSALGTAARGAGMFLLRFAMRQVLSQLATRLDAAPAPDARQAAQPQAQ